MYRLYTEVTNFSDRSKKSSSLITTCLSIWIVSSSNLGTNGNMRCLARCVADYHFSERDNMNGESVLQAYWYGESAQAQMTGLARRCFSYTFPRTIGRSESWGKTWGKVRVECYFFSASVCIQHDVHHSKWLTGAKLHLRGSFQVGTRGVCYT